MDNKKNQAITNETNEGTEIMNENAKSTSGGFGKKGCRRHLQRRQSIIRANQEKHS